ncbi:conserved oligomeric Golgi complex subunit 1 isoform X2 [Oratosquilla oratoria]|uniref:conserved oligomeric Golgi complex subunit 1 isoform X2 n=1 Tax=Oratosquilla oratoria TaxID=337810 RepID=UPI003F773238
MSSMITEHAVEMATESDVTLIFEQHPVAEVQKLLNKTRTDIERKKEELRIMVGERYRDLIEAADTITAMKASAGAISQNIQTMEGLCGSLQQRGLIGFKTQSYQNSTTNNRNEQKANQYSVAVHVKILVSAPEVLWGLTEKKQFLNAAQLLLLARHTHTSLQLSPQANKMLKKFPVVERQWSSIAQFQNNIARGCAAHISTQNQDIQGVCDAVVALMLVEGMGIGDALKKLLTLRQKALEDTFAFTHSTSAKSQVTKFVTIFMATLNMVYSLFVAEGGHREGGLVQARLKEIMEGDAESPISLLQESSLAIGYLPQSVLKFRPATVGSDNVVTLESLQTQMTEWLSLVITNSASSIYQLLGFTKSIKSLATIRQSVIEESVKYLQPEQWDKVCQSVCKEKLNPWDKIIRPQVINRAKEVILNQLHASKDGVIEMVSSLVQDLIRDSKICQEEGDISDFVWHETSGDLPDKVGWTTLATRTVNQAGGLYHKTMGYTSRIQTICRAFNSRLTGLIEDLNSYKKVSSDHEFEGGFKLEILENGENQRTATDYSELLKYLQEQSCIVACRLVVDMKNLVEETLKNLPADVDSNFDCEDDPETSSVHIAMKPSLTLMIVVGRICFAITSLCPQLHVCTAAVTLCQQEMARRISLGARVNEETWNQVSIQFHEEGRNLFGMFMDAVTSNFKKKLDHEFRSAIQQTCISLFLAWETVDIDEEGESGKVKSVIRVPAHPSPALICSLAMLCSTVNCVGIHTIARNLQAQLVTQVCKSYLETMEQVVKETKEMNQTLALQFVFDVRFVQLILLPRDSKELAKRFNSLQITLENFIDPFDLDVFTPHMIARVKQSVQRSQVMLGALVTKDKQLLGRFQTNLQSSSNNTVSIIGVTEIPRFTSVPLPLSTSLSSTLPSLMSMSSSMDSYSSGQVDDSSKKHVTQAVLGPNGGVK